MDTPKERKAGRPTCLLPCPDHTTLSRRNRTVDVQRNIDRLPDGPVCFIVDSTGLKICGQGEWHSRKYGESRHKCWKKLHIAVDKNGWIMASKVTEGYEQDPSHVSDLLGQVDRAIDCFVGDGIYDRAPVYEAVQQHSAGASMIVPPRKGAVLPHDSTRILSQRNQHIADIESTGRANWRRGSVKGGVKVRRVAAQNRGTLAVVTPSDAGCQSAVHSFFNSPSGSSTSVPF
jgi:hypothetical protein